MSRSRSMAMTCAADLGEPRGQRAEPGADLDHPVALAERAGVDDRAIGALVDEKVLAPALLGAQAVLGEQRARVGHAHDDSGSDAVALSVRSARSPRSRRR